MCYAAFEFIILIMDANESEKQLYRRIFGDSDYLTDFLFERATEIYSKYTWEECVALIIATDKILKSGNQTLKIKFLSGVCTDGKFRGKGYFKELLNKVETDAEMEKVSGIMLATYIPAVYEKFDYKIIKKQEEIICDGVDSAYSLDILNVGFMKDKYSELLKNFKTGIVREKDYYEGLDELFKRENSTVYGLKRDGRDLGYILTDVDGNIEETTVSNFDLSRAYCLNGMKVREMYFMFKPILSEPDLRGNALILDVYL